MWRNKRFIIFTVLAAVLLAGSIGGIALAADNGNNSQPEAQPEVMLDRICEIYQQKTGEAIDKEALKDAFTQATSEMRAKALENRPEMSLEVIQSRLQKLVDEGKITQEQADAMLKRWESRPDIPPGFGFKDRGGFRGTGAPWCAPAE